MIEIEDDDNIEDDDVEPEPQKRKGAIQNLWQSKPGAVHPMRLKKEARERKEMVLRKITDLLAIDDVKHISQLEPAVLQTFIVFLQDPSKAIRMQASKELAKYMFTQKKESVVDVGIQVVFAGVEDLKKLATDKTKEVSAKFSVVPESTDVSTKDEISKEINDVFGDKEPPPPVVDPYENETVAEKTIREWKAKIKLRQEIKDAKKS
jgi:hypothetical protein